jgi:geranylgeranyl diphosphate synthase type II
MEYGEAIGLAFQIADDILDVTGKTTEIGKKAGADAAAGRRTFAAIAGLERAKQIARQQAERAVEVIKDVEPVPGPLAALARFSVERRS